MIFGAVAALDDVVHEDAEIRECGHEGLRGRGDGGAVDGGRSAVDSEGALRRKERGDAGCILAAPGRSVTGGEIVNLCGIDGHCHYRNNAPR